MTTPHTPPAAPDVAAIEARAAAAAHAAREYRYCRDCGAVDPPEVTHGDWTFHDGCRRSNNFTGGAGAVATTHGIVGHGTVIELLADNAALLAHVRRLPAALADSDARVASAVAAERARCAAVCRARAEKRRKEADGEEAAAEYGEALESQVLAREADALANALAAPGAGE